MTQPSGSSSQPREWFDLIEIRPLGYDDYSNLRYVNETAVRLLAGDLLSDAEQAAWASFVRSMEYADIISTNRNVGAWLDGQLIATGSWKPSRSTPEIAHITSVFVCPPYAGTGVGSRILAALENDAAAAGYACFSAAAPLNAASFFETNGYRIVSYGQKSVTEGLSIPVAFAKKGETVARTRRTVEASQLGRVLKSAIIVDA